jgi:rhamnopyranosyl-N-acetylglucosaminyl-diphospho-decaprenol beta-1,3/1,4-galactofuranosyltransferase
MLNVENSCGAVVGECPVGAVVVTRNRKPLLKRCLSALYAQTLRPGRILVVDNASTDGTPELVRDSFPSAELIRLEENIGGAGGFYEGIKAAAAAGCRWIWTMDDDCSPEPEALKCLVAVAEKGNVYGSIVLSEEGQGRLAGVTITLIDRAGVRIAGSFAEAGSASAIEATGIGFGGMFIERDIIAMAGLPRKDFFVYADDSEYSLRLRRLGIRMFYVRGSVIRHPELRLKEVSFFGRKVMLVESPPWKAYYSIRNQAYVARVYSMGPAGFYLGYLPRQLLFLVFRAIFLDPERHFTRLLLYITALMDAARGRLGKRAFKEV